MYQIIVKFTEFNIIGTYFYNIKSLVFPFAFFFFFEFVYLN